MGKRILAICCTPYQLLVAAQVLACYYPGEEADLILSDQMSGARKLWEQAKDIWPYGQVYYLEERAPKPPGPQGKRQEHPAGGGGAGKAAGAFPPPGGQLRRVPVFQHLADEPIPDFGLEAAQPPAAMAAL